MIKAKKVFMIIGIVIGSISLFVGGVVGVMAIAGKFKNPEVYPEKLEFVDNGKIIVEGEGYANQPKRLYSFEIVGTNSDEEHEINNPNCKLSFVNNIGYDLIELCDAEANPLSIIEGTRSYLVQCNTPIYFRLKNKAEELDAIYDPNYQYNGEVRLEAVSEREDVKSGVYTFYIDRKIEKIYLQDEKSGVPSSNQQEINVVAGQDFVFDYVVNPQIAMRPISAIDADKIVEVYFVRENTEDYILVDDSSLSSNDELRSILRKENGKLIFNTQDTSGAYRFIIAIFQTYKDRDAYNASARASTDSNYSKVNNQDYPMIINNVKIKPIGTEVQKVEMKNNDTHQIFFSLYKNNSFSLNSDLESGNSLDIVMTKNDSEMSAQDFERYNNVAFNSLYNKNWVNNITPKFTNVESETDNIFLFPSLVDIGATMLRYNPEGIEHNPSTEVEFTIQLSNIKIKNGTVIDCLTSGGTSFKCSNGVALLTETTNGAETIYKIELLTEGTYLDLYDFKDNTFTLVEDVASNFEITSPNKMTYGSTTWGMIPKSEYLDKNLVFGILVINESGLFDIENYFSYKKLVIQPYNISSLQTILKKEAETINVEFDLEKDGNGVYKLDGSGNFINVVNCKTLDFGEFIKVDDLNHDYTYNACAFVTPYDSTGVYNIEVVENIKFVYEGQTYVLVGSFDVSSDNTQVNFNNKIIVRDNETPVNKLTNIYVLQIRNDYQTTFEDYIISKAYELEAGIYTAKYDEPIVIENKLATATEEAVRDIVKIFNANPIQIGLKYLLNKEIISSVVYTPDNESDIGWIENDVYHVYSNQEGLKLTVKSSNTVMFKKLINFYNLSVDETKIVSSSTTNIMITARGLSSNADSSELEITYKTLNASFNNSDYVYISLLGMLPNDEIYTFGGQGAIGYKIFVETSEPDNIAYRYQDNAFALLNIDPNIATDNSSSDILEVKVSWLENNYETKYFIKKKGGTEIELDDFELAVEYLNKNQSGFVDCKDKNGTYETNFKVKQFLTYSSGDSAVFDIETEKSGNTITGYKFVPKQLFNGDRLNKNLTYLSVTMGSTTRYLGVQFVVDGTFDLTTKETITEKTKLNEIVKFTYTNGSSPTDIDVNDIAEDFTLNCLSYGNGVVTYSDDKKTVYDRSGEVILSLQKNNNQWEISRNNANIHYEISIVFTAKTFVGEFKTVVIKFTSSTTANYNIDVWGNELYAGTTILVTGSKNTEGNWLINVKSTISPEYYYQYASEFDATNYSYSVSGNLEIKTADIGKQVVFAAKIGSLYIPIGPFTIVPNVIVNNKNIENAFNSDVDLKISDLFTLSKYSTKDSDNNDIVYGLDASYYVFDGETNTYKQNIVELKPEEITSLVTDETLSLDVQKTKWVQLIGAEENQDVQLRYKLGENEFYQLGSISINVKNGNDLIFNGSEDYNFEIEVKKPTDVTINIVNSTVNENFTLENVEIYNDDKYDKYLLSSTSGNAATLTFDKFIDEELPISLKITFKNKDDDTIYLIKIVEFKFEPYCPTINADNQTIYTRDENLNYGNINLVKDLFNNINGYVLDLEPTSVTVAENIHADAEHRLSYGLIPGYELFKITYSVDNVDYQHDLGRNLIIDGATAKFTPDVEILAETKLYLHYRNSAIKSFVVEKFTDISGNKYNYDNSLSIYNSIIYNGENLKEVDVQSLGYAGGANIDGSVSFADIYGNEKTIYVWFKIEYNDSNENGDSTIYRFPVPLTIKNRLSIVANYPMNSVDLETKEGEHHLTVVSNKPELTNENTGIATSVSEQIVLVNDGEKFEPLLIYTDMPVSVDLASGKIYYTQNQVVDLGVERIKITNRINPDIVSNIKSVELVAYESLTDFLSYVQSAITIDNSTITFGITNIKSGISGLVVFKVTTESGNYCFYSMYLYCNGASFQIGTTAINSGNELKISYKFENTTKVSYSTIIATEKTQFNSEFGVDYDSNSTYLKYYLLNTSLESNEVSGTTTYTNNYRTDTLAVVLVKDEKIIHIGNVILSLSPIYSETTSLEHLKDENNDNIQGNYKAELTADYATNESGFTNPFTVGLEFKEATIKQIVSGDNSIWTISGNSIVIKDDTTKELLKIENGTIKVSGYVSEDLEFRVKYSYTISSEETFDVYVNYTLKNAGVTPTNSEASYNIGSFKTETDPNNSGFVTEYQLSNLVNNYNKKIVIKVKRDNDDVATSDEINLNSAEFTAVELTNSLTLTADKKLSFTQDESEHEYYVTIKYLDMDAGTTEITYKFYLYKGWKVDLSNVQGGVIGSPIDTNLVSDSYSSPTGSTINLVITNHTNYSIYSIGDVKIYDSKKGGVKVSFVDAANHVDDMSAYIQSVTYDNSGTPYYVDLSNKITTENTYTINVCHLAEAKVIAICLDVGSGTSEATKTYVYIRLRKTYSGLQATYLVSDLDYENIIDNYPYEKFNETLLTSGSNESGHYGRFKLIDLKGKPVANADFEAMGFLDPNNKNYIVLSRQNTSKTSYSINQTTLTTNPLDENDYVTICLNNNAGMPTAEYHLQIMASHVTDGLDFSDIASSQTARVEGDNTIIYVIDDQTQEISYNEEFYIGTSLDSKNTKHFDVSFFSIEFGDAGAITGLTPTKSNNNLTYTYTTNNYTVELKYVSSSVRIRINRAKDANISKYIEIKFSIKGSTSFIADNLTLKFYNYGISPVETFPVLAGNEFNIADKIIDTVRPTTTLTYSMNLTESFYTVQGSAEVKQVKDPLLLLYNETTSVTISSEGKITRIQTSSVSKIHHFDLMISVYEGDTLIIKTHLVFNVSPNIYFTVNGESPNNSNGTLETNFVLTNKDSDAPNAVGTKFQSLTKEVYQTVKLTEENANNVSVWKTDNSKIKYNLNGDSYYNYLQLNVHKKNNLGQFDEGEGSTLSNTQVVIYCDVNPYISINNNILTFNSDYTGEFTIYVQYGTADGGVVETEWTLNIIGINTISKVGSNNSIYAGNSTSGYLRPNESVALIDSANANSTGLIYLNTYSDIVEKFASYIDNFRNDLTESLNTYTSDTSGNEKIVKSIKYVVANSNQNLSPEELFESGDKIPAVILLNGTNSAQRSVRMPYVPSSSKDSPVDYLVIYKLEVQYGNSTEIKTFYVTCRVRNNESLSITVFDGENSTKVYGGEVVVENRLVDENGDVSTTKANNTYLDLLTYKETYTATNLSDSLDIKTFYRYYDYAEKVVDTDGGEYTYSETTSGGVVTYTFAGNSATYSTTTRIIDNYYRDGAIYSVFTNPFTSLSQFENYVQNTGKVKIENQYFTLVSLGNGRYGVDLNENYKSNTILLFSNSTNGGIALGKLNGIVFTAVDSFEAYTNDWKTQFNMRSSSKITMNGPGFALNEIFSTEQIISAGLTEHANEIVYAVYDSTLTDEDLKTETKNWATSENGLLDDTTLGQIINNNAIRGKYKLRQITYNVSNSGNPTFYDIKKSVYVIESSFAGIIVNTDFSKTSESSYFRANYVKASWDLKDSIKQFGMDNGVLTVQEVSNASYGYNGTEYDYAKIETDNSENTSIVSVGKETLNQYKNTNPTEIVFAEDSTYLFEYKITITKGENVTDEIVVKVAFMLPETPIISTTISSQLSDNLVVDLVNKGLYVKNTDSHYEIIATNKVVSILEVDSEYACEYPENGTIYLDNQGSLKITLDKDKINSYFNSSSKALTIRFNLTSKSNDGNTTYPNQYFVIEINKQA